MTAGLTRIDEDAVLAEIRETVPEWLAAHAGLERRNAVFEPYFAEIHRRATLADIGMNRYAGDAPPWPGTNRKS
jgi:5-methylthioadenosine/S-adenosylhomocysteine deaminase